MSKITITTKLSVKELGPALGLSVGYVYKMRMAGFAMDWNHETHCYEATVPKARRWIKRHKFKIIRGRVKKG